MAVFTATTRKATTNQFNNIKFVIDSEKKQERIQKFLRHRLIQAKQPAPQQALLQQWLSNRPESALEKFHGVLAHFCNVGCRAGLADALLQRGWAEHNDVARYKNNCNQKRQRRLRFKGSYNVTSLVVRQTDGCMSVLRTRSPFFWFTIINWLRHTKFRMREISRRNVRCTYDMYSMSVLRTRLTRAWQILKPVEQKGFAKLTYPSLLSNVNFQDLEVSYRHFL
jgi:hypothetical protein